MTKCAKCKNETTSEVVITSDGQPVFVRAVCEAHLGPLLVALTKWFSPSSPQCRFIGCNASASKDGWCGYHRPIRHVDIQRELDYLAELSKEEESYFDVRLCAYTGCRNAALLGQQMCGKHK